MALLNRESYRRSRRIAYISFTMFTMLIWVGSILFMFGYSDYSDYSRKESGFCFRNGQFVVFLNRTRPIPFINPWHDSPIPPATDSLQQSAWIFRRSYGIQWVPYYTSIRSRYGLIWRQLSVPLWPLCCFAAIVAALGYYRSRNLPDEFCSKCRYDLKYNSSGSCPECGTSIISGRTEGTNSA